MLKDTLHFYYIVVNLHVTEHGRAYYRVWVMRPVTMVDKHAKAFFASTHSRQDKRGRPVVIRSIKKWVVVLGHKQSTISSRYRRGCRGQRGHDGHGGHSGHGSIGGGGGGGHGVLGVCR